MRRITAAAALGASLLSACASLEPAYERPPAPIPEAFPGGAASPAGVSAADLPWREVLVDLRLQSVVAQALANNRDLRVAAGNVAQARALYRVQRSAQFPLVDGGGGASVSRGPGASGGVGTTESYSVDVGVTAFELDLFGRVRSLSRSALQQYLATEEGARATQISLIGATAEAWLSLAADRELLRLARETERLAGQSVELNQRRLQGGIASQLEVSQAQTILQQARADAAALTSQVGRDRNALELLVGAPVADVQLADRLTPGLVATEVPVGLGSEVLLRRPDVLQAENLLRSANADIGAARAAFFPRLSLTGAAGLASPALSRLFNGDSFVASTGVSASVPIFDAGANRANLALAQAQRQTAVAEYERAIQVAFREVADALATRGAISEQLEANRALVSAAASSFELSEARFREGAEGFLPVLEAQRTLYNAQRSLLAAELTRQTNTVTLYRTLGGGLR